MKKILIVGGKNKAKTLAESLYENHYDVTIINKSPDDAQFLSENKNAKVFLGDGTKPYVLEDANTHEMDIVISLLSNDEDNLLVCELAKKKFKVTRAISLLNDVRKIDFFHRMGVDKVICAVRQVSEFIKQEALLDTITHSVPIREGALEVTEILIETNDAACNKKIAEIKFPEDAIIICVLRGDKTIVAKGDTEILSKDILLVLVKNKNKFEIIKTLKGENYEI